MTYKLKIQKFIDNPMYDKEMEEYKEARKNQYGYNNNDFVRPERIIGDSCLEVELTPEEYSKFKSEVIKIYE